VVVAAGLVAGRAFGCDGEVAGACVVTVRVGTTLLMIVTVAASLAPVISRVNPTSVARNVATSMTLSRASFHQCRADETFAGQADVWAEGENFAGKKARTKIFTLHFD
jgi:hypothetical protein